MMKKVLSTEEINGRKLQDTSVPFSIRVGRFLDSKDMCPATRKGVAWLSLKEGVPMLGVLHKRYWLQLIPLKRRAFIGIITFRYADEKEKEMIVSVFGRKYLPEWKLLGEEMEKIFKVRIVVHLAQEESGLEMY